MRDLPFTLHAFQQTACDRVFTWLATSAPGERYPMASPTGTGKSYAALYLLHEIPRRLGMRIILLTPSDTIILGMLQKLGYDTPSNPINTDGQLERIAVAHGIYTPIRFRNALAQGLIDPPDVIIDDESHHVNETAQTGKDIDTLTNARRIGLTATPFQGTPQRTAEYTTRWGKPNWMISIRDAIKQGVWELPSCVTWPLVNDDIIEVENGQLVASQVEYHTRDKLAHLIELMREYGVWEVCGTTRVPTIITMPGTSTAKELHERLQSMGRLASLITQSSTYAERRAALVDNINSRAVIQIRAVGEGTDVRARLMVDAAPTLSPVLWFQRFGRLTRPGGNSTYICTNLNYQRHCYLLEGAAPEQWLRDSIKAFGGYTERSKHRAFGLQSLGRLQPTKIQTSSGLEVHTYSIGTTEGTTKVEYFVIVHPQKSNPFWFVRRSARNGDEMIWGEWERTAAPNELTGFKSSRPNPLSDAQKAWWKGEGRYRNRGAEVHGLKVDQDITARTFAILPILSKAGLRI